MATGVEISGLTLAVLPLIIQIAKSYARGVDTIRNVASASRHDDTLQQFYDDFWWETDLLHRNLKSLIQELPILCPECKAKLEMDSSLEVWEEDVGIQQALLAYFTVQEDLDAFLLIVSRILNLLDRLVRDPSTSLTSSERKNQNMYKKLKDFAALRKSNQTISTLRDRIRFFKDAKNRHACVKNLKTWNKRLTVLTAPKKGQMLYQPTQSKAPPFKEIKLLFSYLISTIRDHWDCGCPSRHEAMLCLKTWPLSIRKGKPTELEFELLLSSKSALLNQVGWLESTVIVNSWRQTCITDRNLQDCMCDSLVDDGASSLRFLIEKSDAGGRNLWRLRSQPRRFLALGLSPRKSLHQILLDNELKRLKDKRRLALAFACALIQCSATESLSKVVRKECVYFLNHAGTQMDLERPYLPTDFEDQGSTINTNDMSLQHRNVRIMDLGVLLLEIHKGQPLAAFWTDVEKASPSPNTALIVA